MIENVAKAPSRIIIHRELWTSQQTQTTGQCIKAHHPGLIVFYGLVHLRGMVESLVVFVDEQLLVTDVAPGTDGQAANTSGHLTAISL